MKTGAWVDCVDFRATLEMQAMGKVEQASYGCA